MKKYRYGLIIGRFQPFHLGHLEDVKNAAKECETVIIGIGSSQYSRTDDNPFSGEERIEMIDDVLSSEGIENYTIFLVPDVHKHDKWVEHVETIVPKFDIIYTENDFTEKLFKAEGYKVKRVPVHKGIRGTNIRKMIKEGNDGWKRLVPKKTAEFVEKNRPK